MLTVKALIRKNNNRVLQEYNVKVRFTLNRKTKLVSTNLYARPEDLTRSLDFKSGTKIKRQVEKLVHIYYEKINELGLDTRVYSLEQIVNLVTVDKQVPDTIDFITFAYTWIEKTSCKGKKNYRTAVNTLVKYIGKRTLDITNVNKSLLIGFQQYIKTEREKRIARERLRGARITSDRASSLYMSSLRHIYKEAQKEYNDYENNDIRIPYNPFDLIKIPKQEATRKRAISAEQIKAIWDLPYQKNADGTIKKSRYNLAKDCFILSFCLIGMNSTDLFHATCLEGNTIIYNRQKTKDRRLDEAQMQVVLSPYIFAIIDKYRDYSKQRIFKFYQMYSSEVTFNRAINLGLKEIGTILGIEDFEYYAARHSWATIALNKCHIDKYTVHTALNHIDASMRVTDIYIERDYVAENEANKKVIQYVLGRDWMKLTHEGREN